jgi:uncharacterized protein DUF5676
VATVGMVATVGTVDAATTRKPTRKIIMLNIKVVTWSLAIFVTIAYLSCIAFGLITPDSIHMTGFLEQVLPGFRWLTLTGFLLGLVESFLYGFYAGIVFVPVYNAMWKKFGMS